ncbi:MAG TPA: hypothetical protein VG318_17665 [Actinomycetota bacterium]|nr:hypothetical protein [Actinomycetota bacterium]
MRPKTRRLAAVAVAAIAVAAAAPAATARAESSAVAGPCRATSASTGSEVQVVLTGNYTDDSTTSNVTLSCHIVMGGRRILSVTDPLLGPVAALAAEQRIDTAPFYVCYELHIREFLDLWNAEYSTNC